jgi:hypothetical protein
MSKKLLQNRTSKKVTADTQIKFRQALQMMLDLLGEDTPMSDAEYVSLRKIADKLKTETDDVFAIAKESNDFLEESTPLEVVENYKTFYEFCDNCRSMLGPLLFKLNREQNIAGGQYFNACMMYEDNVSIQVARNNPKARAVKAQLDDIPRQRGRPKGTKKGMAQ